MDQKEVVMSALQWFIRVAVCRVAKHEKHTTLSPRVHQHVDWTR